HRATPPSARGILTEGSSSASGPKPNRASRLSNAPASGRQKPKKSSPRSSPQHSQDQGSSPHRAPHRGALNTRSERRLCRRNPNRRRHDAGSRWGVSGGAASLPPIFRQIHATTTELAPTPVPPSGAAPPDVELMHPVIVEAG